MKVTINIPDEVYSELVIIAERNTRTITQEVLHRVKSFGSSVDAGIVHTGVVSTAPDVSRESTNGKGSRVDTGKGTVHTSTNNGGIEGEDVVHTDSGSSASSVKKEEIKSVDTGKKGLPSQEVDGFKTFFKK